jgi:hypothetical protein
MAEFVDWIARAQHPQSWSNGGMRGFYHECPALAGLSFVGAGIQFESRVRQLPCCIAGC